MVPTVSNSVHHNSLCRFVRMFVPCLLLGMSLSFEMVTRLESNIVMKSELFKAFRSYQICTLY